MQAILDAAGGQTDAVYALIQYAALASARTFGATLLFTVFVWGRISSGIIRSVLALALALPLMQAAWADPVGALREIGDNYLLYLVKEVALGLLIGFVASLPFEALGAAGAAIDATRGGGPVPGPGGDSTALGQLFMVVALWLFASLGGFFRFADMIYASYALWPIAKPLPPLNPGSLGGVVMLLERLVGTILTLAGPLILLLLVTDLTLLVANRLGKQMNVFDLSISIKTILLVVVLPLYGMVVIRVATGQFPTIFDLRLLKSVFGT